MARLSEPFAVADARTDATQEQAEQSICCWGSLTERKAAPDVKWNMDGLAIWPLLIWFRHPLWDIADDAPTKNTKSRPAQTVLQLQQQAVQ